MPTVESASPNSSEASPFSSERPPMKMAQEMPSTPSQKYSTLEKLSATSASEGAANVSTTALRRPPITEENRPAPSDRPALPACVSAYESSV